MIGGVSRIPSAGPVLISVPGISGVQIAAATLGAEVVYQWPRPYVVTGFFLSERETAGSIVIANMRIRIVDESASELVTDGLGTVGNMPALALLGRSLRWQPFRRLVLGGIRWTIQIENENAAQTVTPDLLFRLEEEV